METRYIIDDMEVEGDGDWFECPYCKIKSCIVERFEYCPMCGEKLNEVRVEYI